MEINPRDIGFVEDDIGEDRLSLTNSDRELASDSDASDGDTTALVNHLKVSNSSPYYVNKWERLKRYYNDQYLELLNDTYKDDILTGDPHDLLESQIGVVRWTSDEKKLLFAAVAKHGRHNLLQLQHTVGTKSPVEIAAYLDAVRTEHVNRQKFMRNAKNVSLADIPAATEIGIECETALEKVVDALIAYQEQYDIVAGQKESDPFGLIDREIASALDAKYENADTDLVSSLEGNGSTEDDNQQVTKSYRSEVHHVFKLSMMLDLSEQFFMNHDDQSSFGCWNKIAEPGQRPAMTEESLQTFFSLISEYLRKIMKISIQVANARIASMSAGGYSASQKLGQADVISALDILNLPHDSWNHWARLARRNNFKIITGSHSKGESRSQIISHDQAEALLTTRRGRGRRRSMSIGSSTSSVPSDLTTDTEPLSGFGTDHNGDTEIDESDQGSDSDGSLKKSRSPAAAVLDEPSSKVRISHEARRSRLEEASDAYADSLDRVTRSNEEKKIWQILGKHPRAEIDEEEEKEEYDNKHNFGTRPKTLRKLRDELQDWSCVYMAEWERYGNMNDIGDIAAESSDKAGPVLSENDEDT